MGALISAPGRGESIARGAEPGPEGLSEAHLTQFNPVWL